ncbi:hypothetical protein Ddye_026026 [Dipteronia dyeriana]|uniref:Membrane protein insertion efficiency factor YidD n=1 Tax=Dipteronia dyeriana TaxID=168575 RepID=A0AAD9TLH8_9ROSI|nr:hypothetical protein Ddye_026026 [Dipteronia dyeriana]
MKRKVLRLSESSNEIKGKHLILTKSTSKELFEDPLKSIDQSKRWKIKSSYGDIGLTYRDDETIAYVASRMPAFTLFIFESSMRFIRGYWVSRQLKYWILVMALVQLSDDQVDSVGVKAALVVLTFYKRKILPLLLKSCRYVPTCSEYSMEAYKKYRFGKGTILTAWHLCRYNPLGRSGFDPPRWFEDESQPET